MSADALPAASETEAAAPARPAPGTAAAVARPSPAQLRREYLAALDEAVVRVEQRAARGVRAYAAYLVAIVCASACLIWYPRKLQPLGDWLPLLGLDLLSMLYLAWRYISLLTLWLPEDKQAFEERMEVCGLAERVEAGLLINNPRRQELLKNYPQVLASINSKGRAGELVSLIYYPAVFLAAGTQYSFPGPLMSRLRNGALYLLGLGLVVYWYWRQGYMPFNFGILGWLLLMLVPQAYVIVRAYGGLLARPVAAYLRRKWAQPAPAGGCRDLELPGDLAQVERGYRFALILNDLDNHLRPRARREYVPWSRRRIIFPFLLLALACYFGAGYDEPAWFAVGLAVVSGILLFERWLCLDQQSYSNRIRGWLRHSNIAMQLAMQELTLEQFAQFAPRFDLRQQQAALNQAPAAFKSGMRSLLWVFASTASYIESGQRLLARREMYYSLVVVPAAFGGIAAAVLAYNYLDNLTGSDFALTGILGYPLPGALLVLLAFWLPASYGYLRLLRRRGIAALEFIAYLRELAAG